MRRSRSISIRRRSRSRQLRSSRITSCARVRSRGTDVGELVPDTSDEDLRTATTATRASSSNSRSTTTAPNTRPPTRARTATSRSASGTMTTTKASTSFSRTRRASPRSGTTSILRAPRERSTTKSGTSPSLEARRHLPEHPDLSDQWHIQHLPIRSVRGRNDQDLVRRDGRSERELDRRDHARFLNGSVVCGRATHLVLRKCFDLETDYLNCGACGNVCASMFCFTGTCARSGLHGFGEPIAAVSARGPASSTRPTCATASATERATEPATSRTRRALPGQLRRRLLGRLLAERRSRQCSGLCTGTCYVDSVEQCDDPTATPRAVHVQRGLRRRTRRTAPTTPTLTENQELVRAAAEDAFAASSRSHAATSGSISRRRRPRSARARRRFGTRSSRNA